MRTATTFLVIFAALSAVSAHAQELPVAPKLPSRLSFEEELAGRRALWAARDRATSPQGYSFLCRWNVARSDTRGRVSKSNGTETLYFASGNKLSLALEYGEAGRRTLRRAVCDGATFLAVRFDERGKQTTRDFSRFSIGDVGRLDRALASARLDELGQTRGVSLALEPDFSLLTRVWRSADGSILEADSLPPRPGRAVRIHRYTLDKATQGLKRFEQWELREGRTTYRTEDYTAAPKVAAPFTQSLPENYTEKTLTLPARQPEPTTPEDADPKALALLAQWKRAQERFYTLHGTAQVITELQKRAPDSPDPRGRGAGGNVGPGKVDLWLWRPGRALVELAGTDRSQQPFAQTIKATGLEITVKTPGVTNRTQPLRELDPIERVVLQYASRNSLDALRWFVLGPPRPSEFQKIVARGTVVLPGGVSTQLVELSRTDEDRQRNDRPIITETLCRVWLGTDGLPRGFETIRRTTIQGLFERDQPPTSTVTARLTKVTTDQGPPF